MGCKVALFYLARKGYIEAMRPLKTILLCLVLLIAGGVLYLWQSKDSLAERVIKAELIKLGIPVESLTVTAVSTRSITLSDLALGEGGALHAKTATLNFNYDWTSRQLGAFDATIDGAELRAQIEDGQLLIGGIEKAWGSALTTASNKAIAVSLNGTLHLARDKAGHFEATLGDGLLTLIQNQKNMLLPLQVEAKGEGDLSKLTAQGNFHDARNRVKGSFDADYAVSGKTGTITWKTDSMRFSDKGFTFAQFSPGFADGVATVASKLAVSGVVNLKPGQWTVIPKITVLELPVDTLLASVLGDKAVVNGSVKGAVPIRIMKGGTWRIEKSRLINIGPMGIKMDPTAKGTALDAHPQAELVKSALSNLEVQKLTLDVQSTDNKGGVKLDWHFLGRNPELMGGKPVDFTLAVTMNVSDMWHSLQEVKRATRDAEQKLLRKKK